MKKLCLLFEFVFTYKLLKPTNFAAFDDAENGRIAFLVGLLRKKDFLGLCLKASRKRKLIQPIISKIFKSQMFTRPLPLITT